MLTYVYLTCSLSAFYKFSNRAAIEFYSRPAATYVSSLLKWISDVYLQNCPML